jgi:hypothetical protein
MGIDRAIVAGEQARAVEPQQMRVIILDGAWPEDTDIGGMDDAEGSHGGSFESRD